MVKGTTPTLMYSAPTQYVILSGLVAAMSAEELDLWLTDRVRADRVVLQIYIGLRARYGWQQDAGTLTFAADTDDPAGWLDRLVSVMDLDHPFVTDTPTTEGESA